MVLGIFAGLISIVFIGSQTFIGYDALFRWFLLFAFAGNLLPRQFSGLHWGMERLEWFLFNLLAIGPLVLSLGLLLNFTVHGPERLYLVPSGVPMSPARYWAEHHELPSNRPLPPGPVDQAGLIEAEAAISDHILGVADGCLGYAVMTEWKLAYRKD